MFQPPENQLRSKWSLRVLETAWLIYQDFHCTWRVHGSQLQEVTFWDPAMKLFKWPEDIFHIKWLTSCTCILQVSLHFLARGLCRFPFVIPWEQRNTLSAFWEVCLGYLELSLAEPSAAALLQTSSSLSSGGDNMVHANANCLPSKFLEPTENNFSKWSFWLPLITPVPNFAS